jgi:hypothetical protein
MEQIVFIIDSIMRFGFLFRLLQVVFLVAVSAVALYVCLWLLNRGIQLFASLIGVEITDFFEWMKERLPKRRKKRKARKKRVEKTLDNLDDM